MDDESKKTLLDLIQNSKVASLGTSLNNQPFVSMAAYSVSDNLISIYILISQLAHHTKNILGNNKVSLMICQPENSTSNPQQLARITFTGSAKLVERGTKSYNPIKNNYINKNRFAEMYFGLGDFKLFEIEIEKARYVAGFAKTFNLSREFLQNLKN